MKKNSRYWPDWKYELPDKLLAALDEYHILKIPLLGQHYPGGPSDWCGRTSCSMAFNYYQFVQGGDFESKFITHWDGGQQGRFVDLRYPGGQRAFHTKPMADPQTANLEGYAVSDPNYTAGDVAVVRAPSDFTSGAFSASPILGFSRGVVLPYDLPNRKELAARITNDPALIESRLATILKAVSSNNPVIFYSGFSMRGSAPIHLILIAGYAYLKDDTGRHLWLAVADPATHEKKIKSGMYSVPSPATKTDVDALSQLTGKHDMVRVITGNWDSATASLVLIRARKFFEENTLSSVRDDLFMDYCGPNKGGAFIYSHRPTVAPPECVFSNVSYSVAYPMDGRKERFRPVNCYAMTEASAKGLFPLGSHRNLHSGVHLELSSFSRTPPPPPPPAEKKEQPAAKDSKTKAQEPKKAEPTPRVFQREVRCLAPGYIVAVRLANALPEPKQTEGSSDPAAENELAELAKKGLEKNQLSKEFAGNHNSFILVRHDVEEFIPKKEQPPNGGAAEPEGAQAQTPKRFTFYSLYMHLVPPNWKKAGTYQDVAWLKVLARREGSLAVLDPQHEAFQQVRWLQGPLKGSEEEAEIIPMMGGTFATIGSDLSNPQTFQLGDETGDSIRAVYKKPESDLAELHKALIGGEIVTLCHPYLKVRAGELLGYLDDKSEAVGDGFLHWEILAPSEQGQLEQFLKFAEEKLGLSSGGKPFFEFFEEKDQNNFFDPPALQSGSEGELDSLVKLAPVLEQMGDDEKRLLAGFKDTYSQGLLQRLMGSSRALPFYAPKSEDKPAEEKVLSYPVDVLLENFKDCLPEGSYKLRFTFDPPSCPEQVVEYDGKKTRVRIYVPAGARKIFVQPATPGSLFLQSGGYPSKEESLKKDVEHFKTLASVRWRNVVLRHLNDWSPESIEKQVLEHLKTRPELVLGSDILDSTDEQQAKELIKKHAEAIGWWANNEKPVLGPKGEEKPLFADNPDGEQLPRNTFLDNPHPVTFSWLLMLLTRHNLLQFADVPLWHSEELKKIAAIGWLPARERYGPQRVGELVYVGAVQRGHGKDKVALHVSAANPGGWRLEIAAGTFNEGVFAQPVEMPGWGEWSLDEPGAQALGELKLEGLEPVLLKTSGPPGENGSLPIAPDAALSSGKDGTFSWRIAFRANCPRLLRGWILIRKWKGRVADELPKDASAFETADVAIPVVAREDTAFKEEAGFAVVDGFIKKGNVKNVSTYVTQHFTYKEFLDAAKGQKLAAGAEPLIAWDLVEAVERIRSGYAARQPISLLGLFEDGLSIQLRAANLEKLREVVAKAKEDGWIDDAEEVGKSDIRIRVKASQEGKHPGELIVEFDANEAFTELRKGMTHEDQLAVQFGFFFPNGGSAQDGRLLASDTIGTRCEAVKVEELKSLARGGYLEQWSPDVAEVLHSPMFGEPELQLTSKGAQVCVPLLGGTASFWNAAGPSISFGKEELDKKAKSAVLPNPLRVVRALDFNDKNLKGKQLVISASVKKKDVPLKTERIDVRPSKRIQYDMAPNVELEAQPALYDPFILNVSLRTNALPASRGFKIEIANSSGNLLTLPKDCVTYELRTKEAGVTDSKGVFRAKVDVSDIAEALKGAKEYVVRVVPLNKADRELELTSSKSLTVPEPLQQEEAENVMGDFPGMWPDGREVPMKSGRV
ncbi:hypothetical protein JQX13_49580 [Archangium violaceum]|uniref:hypothetical protein n=1 Tax=Archangium violaceum TaxID=83451 RepID=UPI00193B11CE|nr:hypothetical protein [Archangium violaceum]QRK07932.1 hypothetical protein JQX13_49580 [Archangium violaceum]